MSGNYDNWERLVKAVLRQVQFRQLALQHSRNSSYLSDYDGSSDSTSGSDSPPSGLRSFSPGLRLQPMYVAQNRLRDIFLPPGIPFFLAVESRELTISCGQNSQHPELIFNPALSKLLIAKIDSVEGLDVRGRINTRIMTPNTLYGAFLVYKLDEQFRGRAEAVIRFVNKETDTDAESRAEIVNLQPVADRVGEMADTGKDGWMEVQLGQFYVGEKDDTEVEARLMETTRWNHVLSLKALSFDQVTKSAKYKLENSLKISGSFVVSSYSILILCSVCGEAGSSFAKSEEDVEDISLLQQFALKSTNPVPLASNILEPPTNPIDLLDDDMASTFRPEWNLMTNSSLQDKEIGIEMTSKLLLPKDDRMLSSLTRDEIFSGGYSSLSQAVYFFHGMRKLIEQKEREVEDLKYKLLRCEIDAQFVIGAKDSELEKLRKMVEALKGDLDKCEKKAKDEKEEAEEKIKEVERNLVNAETSASVAVERYRNSEEMRVEKHRFASKAFTLGFELCKTQVAEIDPSFDIGRIDVKKIEAHSSSS